MFRVDPKFKKNDPVSQLVAPDADEYTFVQLTYDLPIWLLLAISIDSESGDDSKYRYQFSNLSEILQVALYDVWKKTEIYELIPGRMTKDRQPILVQVEEVWECAENKCVSPSYEVKVASGVQFVSANGRAVHKSKRILQLWPRNGSTAEM